MMFPLILFCALIAQWTDARHHNSHHRSESKYFDLGYSFNEDTIYYPGQKQFFLNKDYDGVINNGIWYSAFSFCMGEHGGTHVDAPFHFFKEGWTLDKIPESHLINVPSVIVDVEEAVDNSSLPSQFLLDVKHLIDHEKVHGEIPKGSVVLIHTGWSKYYPDKVKYLGWDNSTEGKSPVNFPGLSLNAAKWLVNERQIVGVGIDTPSVDAGMNNKYPVHIFLAKSQIYGIENVANLHLAMQHSKDPACSLRLFVLPIKLVGGTGGPTRILAFCK